MDGSIETEDVKNPGSLTGRFLKACIQLSLIVGVGYGTYTGIGALFGEADGASGFKPREKEYTVQTQIADPKALRQEIGVFGTIVAGRSVELRALVGGPVVKVSSNLKAGSVVRKGEVLAEIDPFNFKGALSEARANLAEAKARLKEARARIDLENTMLRHARSQLDLAVRDEERALSLVENGTVTSQTVDTRRLVTSQRRQAVGQRERNLEIEAARVGQQQAVIARLEWQVERAERDVENTRLRAPFDAVVMTETVEPGRMLSVNDVVTSLYDIGSLEVRFTLSDAQFGRISKDDRPLIGRAVDLKWRLGDELYSRKAVIDRVGAEVASDRGGVDVFARLEDGAKPSSIRPGAFVELQIPGHRVLNAVRVPEAAVYGGNQVFIIKDNRLKSVSVSLAGFEGEQAIIQGGLKKGDEIVVNRLSRAGDGLLVIREGEASKTSDEDDSSDKIAELKPSGHP
ncbi:efflux RND transporter periplasmic adaptor subunit [Coralliovum pocilloporae]|uniref:efflux RND transporter periplasmic adaptor subunit n=1 Tax=Coralliovum pocilloporae TaxID=3066369 RepID=UPI0033072754